MCELRVESNAPHFCLPLDIVYARWNSETRNKVCRLLWKGKGTKQEERYVRYMFWDIGFCFSFFPFTWMTNCRATLRFCSKEVTEEKKNKKKTSPPTQIGAVFCLSHTGRNLNCPRLAFDGPQSIVSARSDGLAMVVSPFPVHIHRVWHVSYPRRESVVDDTFDHRNYDPWPSSTYCLRCGCREADGRERLNTVRRTGQGREGR